MSDRVGMFIDSKKLGSVVEEIEVVAHEAGHIMTGSLHKVYSPYDLIERHEYRANMWAFQQLVPVDKLVSLHLKGCRESGEYADALEVSEAFLVDALQYYHDTYGYNYQFGGYTVNFLPFSVQ